MTLTGISDDANIQRILALIQKLIQAQEADRSARLSLYQLDENVRALEREIEAAIKAAHKRDKTTSLFFQMVVDVLREME